MKTSTTSRRWAALVVAAASAIAMTGCAASSGSDDGSAELTMQVWGDTKFAEDQFTVYQETFPEESEGQSIKVLSAGENDTDSINQFRLALSSGKNIPDILQLNYNSLAEFAEAGVLADVEELAADFIPNVTESAQTLMQYDGKYIAIPYEVKKKLWFYRTDLFEQAGIDVTQVKTQEDFIEAGKKLQAAVPGSYIWNLGPSPATYDWQMITSGNGAQYSEKEPSCAFTVGSDEGTAEAFRAIKDIRESGVVETSIDDWSPEWQTALADGTIASELLASWFPSFLAQYAPDLAGKWAVTTWPEIGGAIGGSEAAGSVFVVTEASKNKEAAVSFLAHTLMDEKGAKAFVELGGGYVPDVVSLQDDPEIANNDYFGTSLMDAVKAADADYKVFPFDPAAIKEQEVLGNAMNAYLASDQADPASFLEAAEQELTAQIGCPYTN